MSIARMLLPLGGALLLTATAQAQSLPPPYVEYAAKFTCGTESAKEPDDVVAGVYASSINIHNPQSAKLSFHFLKKIVVANREDSDLGLGRIVILNREETLKSDQAERVDCAVIHTALKQSATAYVEGFVVLEVPRLLTTAGAAPIQPLLDVVAKYTARASNGGVAALSVVQIDGKAITN